MVIFTTFLDNFQDLLFQYTEVFSTWWIETFWHEGSVGQGLWILASFVISFVIIRIIYDDKVKAKLSQLLNWLSSDKENSNTKLLARIIDSRLLFLSQFLIWIGIKIFENAGWPTAWLFLSQNLLLATIIVSLFNDFFKRKGAVSVFTICVWGIGLINGLNLFDQLLPWLDWGLFNYSDTSISLLLIFKSMAILFVGIWLIAILVGTIEVSIREYLDISVTLRILIVKIGKYGLFFLIFILAAETLGVEIQSLSFFAGAVGLGLGFGLQKLISNLSSGVVLLVDKSIKPGDLIELDGKKGVVQEMTARAVRITDLKNIDYIVPNDTLISSVIINWSHNSEHVYLSVVVGVDYNCDLDLAMKLMIEATTSLKEVSKKHKVNCFIKDFADSSIELLVSFVVSRPSKGYFGLQSSIRYNIWKAFKENNISIPFPQLDARIVSNANK